jgi:hypothetical protein
MFCDRLLSDADWQMRYALDAAGRPMPFELIEREIRETQPFLAQSIRNMLVVCYAEKALYETPDDELQPDHILEVLRETEARITLAPGGNPRPTLAVPHLLSREASAYYHGYVLAQMAVYQTREYFRGRHGRLVDNPAIGEELARVYWAPGNSRSFLDLIRELTGREFSADALAGAAELSADEAVRRARAGVEALDGVPVPEGEPDLDLRLRVVHGAEVVVDEGHSPLEVARRFRRWLSAQAGAPRD